MKKIKKSEIESKKYYVQDEMIRKEIEHHGKMRYLTDYAGFPVTKNNDVVYYATGEEAFSAMKKELKQAEKYIFLEYFIIAQGIMWDEILKILESKVKKGVEVRILYDDFGCINTLPENYKMILKEKGIKCIVFNELKVLSGVFINHRDHRKILIIDGKVAFSGGINIGDEYINQYKRFGHWKDNGIKLSGDSVWNLTIMFLTMWNAYQKEDKDFKKYKYDFSEKKVENGYVIPYAASPQIGRAHV